MKTDYFRLDGTTEVFTFLTGQVWPEDYRAFTTLGNRRRGYLLWLRSYIRTQLRVSRYYSGCFEG